MTDASFHYNPTSQCVVPLVPNGAFQRRPCNSLARFDMDFPLRCSGNSWRKVGKSCHLEKKRNPEEKKNAWAGCNVDLSVYLQSDWAPIAVWDFYGNNLVTRFWLIKFWEHAALREGMKIFWDFLQSRPLLIISSLLLAHYWHSIQPLLIAP